MHILQWCLLILIAKEIGAERARQARRYEGEVEVVEDNDWNIELMVPGRPNQDYPILNKIPKTAFTCSGKTPGYYADLATECQVFRVCLTGSTFGYQSFLCPNGTLFNQVVSVCDWWMNVNCARTENKYISNSQKFIKTGPKMMNDIKQMLTYPMRNPYSFFNSAPQGNLTMQVYKAPANQMYPRRSAKQTLEYNQNGYQYPRQNLEDLSPVEEIGSNSAEEPYYAASTPSAFYVPTSNVKFDDNRLRQVVQSSLPSGMRSGPFIQGTEVSENNGQPNKETISSNKQSVIPKPLDTLSYRSWIIPIDNETVALSPQNLFPFLQAKANLDKDWTNATITLETYVTNNTVRSRTIVKRLKNFDDDRPLSKVDIGSAVSDIIKDTGTILNSSTYTSDSHSQRQTVPVKGGYQIRVPVKQLSYPPPVERLKQIASTYLPPTTKIQKSDNLKALPQISTTAYSPSERFTGSSYLPPIYEKKSPHIYHPPNQIQRPAQLRATTVSPQISIYVPPQAQKINAKYLQPEMLEQFRAVNSYDTNEIEVNKRLYSPSQMSDKIRKPSSELQPPYIVAEIFTKHHKTVNLTSGPKMNENVKDDVMYPLQLNDNITFTLKIPYPILKKIMENKKNSDWNHLEVLHTGDSNYLVLAKKQNGKNNNGDNENYIPLGRLMFNDYFNGSQPDLRAINNAISKTENIISNRNLGNKQPFEQLRVAPQVSDSVYNEPVETFSPVKLANIKQANVEVTAPKQKPSGIQSNKMYSSTYNTRKTLEGYHQKVQSIPNYQTTVSPDRLRGSKQLIQNYAERFTSPQANLSPSSERQVNNYQSEDIPISFDQEPSIYNNFENFKLEMEQLHPNSQQVKGEQVELISEKEQFNENIGNQVELFQQNIQGRDQNYNGKLIMRYPNPNSESAGPTRGYSYCAGSNNAEDCNENEIVNNPFPKITFPSNGTSQSINKILFKDNYYRGAPPQFQFSDRGQAHSGKLIALPRAPAVHPSIQNMQEQYNSQRDAYEEQRLISEAINAQLLKEEQAGRLADSFASNEEEQFPKVYTNPASNIVTSVQLVPSVEFEIEGEGENKFISNMANHLVNNGVADNYQIVMGEAGPYAVIDLPQSFHPGNSGKNSISYYVQHFNDGRPISNQALPQQLRMAPEGYPPYRVPQKTLSGLQNPRTANLELEEPDRSYLPAKQVGYPRIRPLVPFTF